ncbi:hypothetical protein QQZ08_009614 [Neonectria magnoliae]|uniref:CmcJ-like methyltransferase n=1 Tax=Neonectria magnoliae TaxID=2732573 RepID=A0ABR1HNL3_9HYPO
MLEKSRMYLLILEVILKVLIKPPTVHKKPQPYQVLFTRTGTMDTESSMWFLSEGDLYQHTKPYRLMFVPTDPAAPRSNLVGREVANIRIRDIRLATEEELTFDRAGLMVLSGACESISYEDRGDVTKLHDEYFAPLHETLKAIFHAWKPLNGPIKDWPLALCDASTVNVDTDLEKADAVQPDTIEENYQVYYRPQQRWYYVSEQKNSEVLLFRVFDSVLGQNAAGVPHAAFQHPGADGTERPRESIEANLVLWWD